MPISESDPRVFFAAERTLLAWLRTGLTIIALGFVVSRFGLFVQLLAAQSAAPTVSASFFWSGILGIAFAAGLHQRLRARLSALVAALGLALAAYLLLTA